MIRDDGKYRLRFENFSKFYRSLLQQPYPLDAPEQGLSFLFEETRVQFISMNSAWEIDKYFPDRACEMRSTGSIVHSGFHVDGTFG